ncbi:hypothetical protein [Nostoc sp. KVJ20]|uniref:hypothetical protein n=1 Tax=Nostoc sp. KVJ20 TaxID=457944 RepID=UPI00159F16FF|nr:hypothetical protein [Nostoc sp. KVJ20]
MGNRAWGIGHGAWGMGHGEESPMPQVGGWLSLSTPLAGWNFSPTFDEVTG